MAITIAHGTPQTIWTPVQAGATVYVGGIVMVDSSAPTEGVLMLADASGVANDTNKDIPLGVVIGTNRKSPTYSSTYKCEYITCPGATDPHGGSDTDYFGVEGPWAKGDPVAMVKVAMIEPNTVLRAPLYATSVGTAPVEVTATNTSSDGLGITTGAIDFTAEGTNAMSTIYCRTGANAGSYRLLDSNSSTVHTWDRAMKHDIAIGDTFVAAPMRYFGPSTCMFDSTTAAWIDCDDASVLAGTDRWSIIVYRLDLSEAGKEYCEFRFDAGHFGQYIANE